jgi:hypothetical protein
MGIRETTEAARIDKSVMREARKIAKAEARQITRVLSDLIRAGLAQREQEKRPRAAVTA